MEPQQKSEAVPLAQPVNQGGSLHIKEISLVIGGLFVGAIAVFCYFLFLAPKPESIAIEETVENIVLATTTLPKIEPIISNNFRTIDLNNFSTSTVSAEDVSIVQAMKEIVKDAVPFNYVKVVINPTYNLLTVTGGSVGPRMYRNFVIDMKNKKIIDKFIYSNVENVTQLGQGTFVFEFNSYTYGATSSFQLKGTSLENRLTYDSRYADRDMYGDELELVVTATTSNSITYAIFEEDESAKSRATTTMYKKVGERMFIIP